MEIVTSTLQKTTYGFKLVSNSCYINRKIKPPEWIYFLLAVYRILDHYDPTSVEWKGKLQRMRSKRSASSLGLWS